MDAEGLVTVGAVLAATATLLWGLNVVMTVLRGKLANVEGLPLDQVVEKVGEELSAPTVLASVSTPVRSVLSVSRRALSRGYSLGVLGAALIVVSSFVIAFAHSTYDLYTWTWIVLLTIGIFLVAIPVMRDSKAV